MNNQMTIFDLIEKQKPVVFVSSRRNDPDTSREAEARIDFRDKHYGMILQALETPAGKDLIAERCGLTGVQICRRLSELERLGKVRVTGKTTLSKSGRNERMFERV